MHKECCHSGFAGMSIERGCKIFWKTHTQAVIKIFMKFLVPLLSLEFSREWGKFSVFHESECPICIENSTALVLELAVLILFDQNGVSGYICFVFATLKSNAINVHESTRQYIRWESITWWHRTANWWGMKYKSAFWTCSIYYFPPNSRPKACILLLLHPNI